MAFRKQLDIQTDLDTLMTNMTILATIITHDESHSARRLKDCTRDVRLAGQKLERKLKTFMEGD